MAMKLSIFNTTILPLHLPYLEGAKLILRQMVMASATQANPLWIFHDADVTCANAESCAILPQCHIKRIDIQDKSYAYLPYEFEVCELSDKPYHTWDKDVGQLRGPSSCPTSRQLSIFTYKCV